MVFPIKHSPFPAITLKAVYFITASSFVYFIWQILKKFIQEGKWIPLNSVAAFITLYIWHIPALFHPGFFLMIPFFHSLQYLLFAFAYTKNRFASLTQSPDQIEYRKTPSTGRGVIYPDQFYYGWIIFPLYSLLVGQKILFMTQKLSGRSYLCLLFIYF